MKTRMLNEYRMIYRPDHPTAMITDNWKGYVYEHIYIMEIHLGRSLLNDEVVHHLDGNRGNNKLDNLILLTREMHGKLHAWIDKGCPFKTDYVEAYCETCGVFLYTRDSTKHCSTMCSDIAKRKVTDRPTIDELLSLLKNNSYVSVAKMFNVSDNAVRKWVKSYGYNPKTLILNK